MSSLYILEIKPFSEVSLANTFPHKVGSPFILLMFSLAVQKLFILMKNHLFIISFMFLAPGDILVKILLHGVSEIFLPVFSSGTFMVSQLIFKSFNHLEFICVYGVGIFNYIIFIVILLKLSQFSPIYPPLPNPPLAPQSIPT